MSSGFDPDSEELTAVTSKVAIIEDALKHEDFDRDLPVADELVAVTTRLLDDLMHYPDPSIDAELAAALQVYRNAAFAFRRLARTTEDQTNAPIVSACATLIEQGHDHFQRFIGRLGRGHQ